MLKRNDFWLGAVLAAGLALPGFAQETTADTVIATVNGVDITLGHMIATKTGLPEQYRALPDDVLFEGILSQLIQQTVLSQALEGEPSRTTTLPKSRKKNRPALPAPVVATWAGLALA